MSFQLTSASNTNLRWSIAYSPKQEEQECGDTYFVKEYESNVLIAVIDGLGHGHKAAEASKKAVELLSVSSNGSLIKLMEYCHEGLKKTRGVVMSLALINPNENIISWMGVGNVEGVLIANGNQDYLHKERIVLRGGIVGYSLPQLKANMAQISKGAVIILTTDGVRSNYLEVVDAGDEPEEIVRKIALGYFKQTDDALALAVKYEGKAVYEYEC